MSSATADHARSRLSRVAAKSGKGSRLARWSTELDSLAETIRTAEPAGDSFNRACQRLLYIPVADRTEQLRRLALERVGGKAVQVAKRLERELSKDGRRVMCRPDFVGGDYFTVRVATRVADKTFVRPSADELPRLLAQHLRDEASELAKMAARLERGCAL